jgi:hypothetical protein
MHSRNLDSCCDWFCRGQSIYDIDESGHIIVRAYGAGTEWKVMSYYPNTDFAFLGRAICEAEAITYVREDATLHCIAQVLGRELRNSKTLVINGRKTSVEHYTNALATEVLLMPHQYRAANFYCGTRAQSTSLENMNVLASAEYRKDLAGCNDFRDYVGGTALFDHLEVILKSTSSSDMLGACYHMGAEDSSHQITYYQGHLDKAFVSSGLFIPLGVSFFTFVSFPTAWQYQQDVQSLASYNEWINTLEENEREKLGHFTVAFKEDAKIPMKNVDCRLYIFENKIGSLLAFPTNICYHTTLTPPSSVPRDLLIVHPLVGDTKSR